MKYQRPAIESRQLLKGLLWEGFWPSNGGGGSGRGSV
jgi:hypothetical protein